MSSTSGNQTCREKRYNSIFNSKEGGGMSYHMETRLSILWYTHKNNINQPLKIRLKKPIWHGKMLDLALGEESI